MLPMYALAVPFLILFRVRFVVFSEFRRVPDTINIDQRLYLTCGKFKLHGLCQKLKTMYRIVFRICT